MTQPKIGDRRIHKAVYPYTARGAFHKHIFTIECEITKVYPGRVEFKTVRVVDETDRPPENAKDAPMTGGCTIEKWVGLPTTL